MAFGVWKGVALASIAVWIGASMGSIGSFLLGRYLFRDFVVAMARSYPLFQAIDRGEKMGTGRMPSVSAVPGGALHPCFRFFFRNNYILL